ncbi:branched-chain amino acid ABC transporter permease [Micromonospora endophytica]|uniref:Branched-chain amino acid ABC transporter permease n=1 Tax=Micromonospora endophytica TaxID=515350 RepID=A0A2W2D8C0_9ACTN|nr:branched-chain amino acid ABC transporter permease [Micromonospora endophytica]PZF96257.1 branched-chain amino acid ABC transporter permease [Micromonospora endophytica]RIW43112.1 branched-chain amino acid ABC transporter permease [Micromonospora endophytica]BCJ60089.1 branched-chain amino acid ABC transporter permease [Micromonospora endophytica]
MTEVKSPEVPAPPAAVPAELTGGRVSRLRPYLPLLVLVVAVILPYSTLHLPGIFEGALNSPGTLQLLAVCLVFGGLAAGYDLLFGRTGMLSFGHALYFAAGVYGTDILITRAGLPLWQAAPLAIVGGTILAGLIGAVALRTVGIAFAMVTLAFAQVGAILVARDFGGLTGGEEGLPLDVSGLPAGLVGVANTVNLYWLALAYLVVVVLVVHRVSGSPTGRVLAGLRDDERRIGVLGLDPYRFKLVAFTLAGGLAAAGGVVYCLIVGGASPHITSSELTLSLLVMVVLGGPGTRWGPVLGGILYMYLDHRLVSFGSSGAVEALPAFLSRPLSEPLFVLGTVFILAVYFFPGGLASLAPRLALLRDALRPGRRRED